MTKYPVVEWFCTYCDRIVQGSQKNDACPVCLTPLVPLAT